MSPILKRDIAEHVRQARRLAAAVGVADSAVSTTSLDTTISYASGPSLRTIKSATIPVPDNPDPDPLRLQRRRSPASTGTAHDGSYTDRVPLRRPHPHLDDHESVASSDDDEGGEYSRMLRNGVANVHDRMESLEYAEPEGEVKSEKWTDFRNLLLEVSHRVVGEAQANDCTGKSIATLGSGGACVHRRAPRASGAVDSLPPSG
jgi:hypothetical protein